MWEQSAAEIVPPQQGVPISTDVNPEARQQLNTMGYTNTQIDNLSVKERAKILTEGIPSEEYYKDPAKELTKEGKNCWYRKKKTYLLY